MRNHAVSFAENGYKVQHVGYAGTTPHRSFVTNKNIDVFYVLDTPEFHKYMPRLAAYGVKVLWQTVCLLWTLCQTSKSSHLLLQNPPAIPTLAVAWLFCLFRCTRLRIDVLYDKAAPQFKSLSVDEKHKLYLKLSKNISDFKGVEA
ncbi:hypothetical protein EB796_004760 [Bugula neritina]|uniref:Uncharacterized protein n=1 Tax=Bugula neritina TaxID=10212 RepID=A0A7J7KGC4_BUGNE|nr:hypothetical protein EB796_004760 [Bugula neritina]